MKKSNSVSFLPSILSSNRIIKKRKKLNLGLFMTISDDMGFANKQIEKIDDIFKKDKENDKKFWQKHLSNNIYNLNGKTNHQILRELTQRFKLVKDNDITKVDFSKQPYLNNRQVNQILDGNKISKRVLEKAEIERKIKDKKTYLNEFISQTKSVSLNNLKMKLIGKERMKVAQKEKDYENALKYELRSLEKDIENFDKYKIEEKQQIKNDEITLNKLIQKNKILFEENKRQLHEYKFLVEEIIRYIKLIINYKTYASFVHTLLDDENKILTINLNEYINYKNWTEKDLNKYIKKALNELNLYLKEISLNEKTLDILSDNNRLELLFQIMEDNILQVFKQREAFEAEEKRIMEENMKIYDKLMNDYENNKAKYELYINELEDDKKILDKYNMDPESYDYYTEMNFLLNDLCHFVVDENSKEMKKSISQLNLTTDKTEDESGFYLRRDVNKCVEILTKKQFYVQDLITEIETYKQNDPELFRIIIGEVRINNRIKRREIEKQKNLKKELTKRENIIKKYRQNILRQKYKFREPIPYHIVQERKKHVVIYKPESTATNLLFY